MRLFLAAFPNVAEYGNVGLWDATPLGLRRLSLVVTVPNVAEYGNVGLWDATPLGL